MMEFLADRFAPGPVFGWICAAALLLGPLAIWLSHHRRAAHSAVRFSALDRTGALGASWVLRTRFVVPLLRTLAVIALVVALARPQAGGEYRDRREGIAVQMVIDVSGSMQEEDFVLDGRRARRMDAVKEVFRDFVLGGETLRGRENDLIGMTTFAMYADTICPLTLDHGSLIDLLDETDIPGWVRGRQVRENPEANYTSLGEAIVVATDDLRRAGEQAVAGVPGAEAAQSRVMILLTDGADNPAPLRSAEAPSPIEAAKVAATLGIRIYPIGAVGQEFASRRRGLFFQPRAGVDEASLREIARLTGGRYFRATDTESLVSIYDEIDRLERRQTGERVFRDDVRAARLAMFIALGLLMLELCLVNGRYRRIP